MIYKAPDNSLHDDMDGTATHLLPAGSIAITGEAAGVLRAATYYTPKNTRILAELTSQEAKVTPRMIREASLGSPPAELLAINDTITALRTRLKTASTEKPDLSMQEFEVSPAIFGADPTVPLIPAVTRKETFEEYVARLAKWLEDHKHD